MCLHHRPPLTKPRVRRLAGLAALVLSVTALGAAPTAMAQSDQPMQMLNAVAAVVNDRAITFATLEARVGLALLASGLEPSDENRERLRPEVLRTLIDEELQVAAGEEVGVRVTDADIDEAIETIATNNNMTRATFESLLERGNVSLETLEEQVRAGLYWRGVVSRRIIPRVEVTEEAARDVLDRIEQTEGEPEYLLSDLFLPVDSPSEEADIQILAASLVESLRDGSTFGAVAAQFSSGAGAANGGDMGWVLGAQLDPVLREAVEAMSSGEISDPVRTAGGYHILLLRNERLANTPTPDDDEIVLGRLILPIPQPATQGALAQVASQLERSSTGVSGCDALQDAADLLGAPPVRGEAQRFGSLPEPLRDLLDSLEIGDPTGLIRLPDGLGIFMMCERTPADGLTLEQVLRNMQEERIDLAQQRYLSDLRRGAMVDIRIE